MFFLTWKWSFGVYESNENYAFGKERCAFYPSAKLCEKKKRVMSIFFLDHSLLFSRMTRVRMPNGFQAH